MAAIVTMLALWQGFDPRVMIIFVVCVAISEIFVQLRWRLSIACRQCGFDPILYKKDHAAALQKVQVQLDNRKENPRYLLSKPLNLPTLTAAKSKALQERTVALQEKAKGRLVSRSI